MKNTLVICAYACCGKTYASEHMKDYDILDVNFCGFKTIRRLPNEEEIDHTIEAILTKVPSRKLWINPDCGLKTRGITETKASLVRLVEAAKAAREKL